jgi:hypothetical protein
MALKYFRGRIDLDNMSFSELSEAAAAIATLERLAKKAGFEFDTGNSRKSVPRPDVAGSRGKSRSKLQTEVILALATKDMLIKELLDYTAMKSGSLSPHLSALQAERLVASFPAPNEDLSARGRKTKIFSLTETGRQVAAELNASRGKDEQH